MDAQQVLMPQINEATIRLLTRTVATWCWRKAAACGALTHHLGQDSTRFAKANIDAWTAEKEGSGLDAVVINASGCGTTVKETASLALGPELCGEGPMGLLQAKTSAS